MRPRANLLTGLLVLIACGLVSVGGCVTSAYDPITNYPDSPRLRVWPENGDRVVRNAAIWVEVVPSYARVTDFALYEVYGASKRSVSFTASKRDYSNEYLFCPASNLASYSDYEVWLEVDRVHQYRWTFRTNNRYSGSPNQCYYAQPRMAEVTSKGLGEWTPYAIP